ncbi:MAG: hypothetical protein ACOCV2_02220 [Persicimonas sp.]
MQAISKRRLAAILVAAGLLVAPAALWAQADPGERVDEADEEEGEESEEGKDWEIEGELESRIGQGTFVDPANDTQYADEVDDGSNAWDRANLIFSLKPSYTLDEFTFDAEISMVQWLTAAGGQTGTPSSSGANRPQEFALQDTEIGAGWAGYLIEPIETQFIPRLFVGLPTSQSSRTNTMLFSVGTELVLSRSILDKLNASLVGSAIKYNYANPSKTIAEENVGPFRADGTEALGNGRVRVPGFMNTQWITTVAGALDFEIIENLNASISYALIDYFQFSLPEDEYTAENADGGTGHQQFVSGVLGLEYGLNDNVTLGAGTYTVQPPLTADNKSVRFPFWNFNGAANNYSAFTMSVTGTY